MEFPKWMKENDDGTFTITTRHGKFIMEEQTEDVVQACAKLGERTKTPMESLLVTRSLVGDEVVKDEDFGKLKGSVSTRLKIAVTYLYDLGDFLQAHKAAN